MKFGLLPDDIEVVTRALQAFPAIERAVIFGSRAKGNFKPGSDIDIAIMGPDIDQSSVASLSFLLNEESVLPYYFDIVHYDNIGERELREHIDRVGQILYMRGCDAGNAFPGN